MRNVVLRAILVLMILSLGVTTGHAQLMGNPDDPYLEVMYQDYGDQTGTGGASVYYCAAKGSWGGYCRACTTVNGQLTCGDSKYSAKCECSGNCNPYKGMCTYER